MKGLNGIIRRAALLLLTLPVCAVAVSADVKIKTRQTSGGRTHENTTHIKGKRLRTEMMDNRMVTIKQCDLRRDIEVMPQAQVYTVKPYDAATTAGPVRPPADKTRAAPGAAKGGVVTSTVETRDTGERKQMFGYTARRVVTTSVTESSPDACTPMKAKMVIDGWYIDAAFDLSCDTDLRYRNYRPEQRDGCADRYETRQVGAARTGYAVWEKMTMYGEDGSESFSTVNEVVELSQTTLDAALFEVPAGYREVKDTSEMYGAMAAGGGATGSTRAPSTNADDDNAADEASDTGTGAGVKGTSRGETADASSPPLRAKKEGVVRLGVVAVRTGSVGDGMSAAELGSAIQNTLTEYLKGPGVEVVRLESRLPAQIEAEAGQKECDYVIYANVSHKKGGGGFGKMFGGGASVLGGVVSMGGASSTAGAVASSVASTAVYTAASMSASVKSKDELTIDLRVQSPGSAAPAVARQFKAKSKSNGEDIISPLVEQAARAVIDAAAGR